jgi:hypothetical protein
MKVPAPVDATFTPVRGAREPVSAIVAAPIWLLLV